MDSLAQILDSDSDGEEDNDNATICTDIQEAESVKEGEIQPTDCLTPKRHARRKYGSNGVSVGGGGANGDGRRGVHFWWRLEVVVIAGFLSLLPCSLFGIDH